MIILGIDPGLATTGFGAIQCKNGIPSLVTCGHIRTSPADHISSRLSHIHADIDALIHSLHPELIAVENAFSLVKYPRAGILLGSVLGIIYLSVSQNRVALLEITPREIKNSLVGYGGAGKYQIKSAVTKMLRIESIQSLHASDALAIALTAFNRKFINRGKTG